ncbi:MAG TPA: phosphatase PAP2 family protein [Acetobacteraceae bacterium]|nr:phosphatase PAP2 family protein [Acetobacteraceae bacterium]
MSETDPARRRAMAGLVSCAVLLPVSILFLDRPIASFSHAVLHGIHAFIWLTWIADVPAPAAILGLAGAGLAWIAGWRPGAAGRTLLALCLATLLALAIKDQLKFACGRLWPETWVNNNPSWIGSGAYGFAPFHGGAGWGSFPSGHTTAITAPCAVLWARVRAARPLWAALVLLVAVGLLGADFHFFGDVLGGLYLGVACAAFTLAVI